MIIAGAGMAGLLAANMLGPLKPLVLETQDSLPNNHSAVLRFRTSVVGDTLGIPFKRVSMIKDSAPWRNPVADALAYSHKNTGLRRSDRSITAGLVAQDRYIAPSDLLARMAERATIQYSTPCDFASGPIISTIPMPALMRALNYPDQPTFSCRPATNIKAGVPDCDAYVSLMVPDPKKPFSRISLTGDELVIECPGIEEMDGWTAIEIAEEAASLLGLSQLKDISWQNSTYAKILPIDDHQRREFMHWATDKHNVFSLGRFATWRPGLLLDDLVQDIRMIAGWLNNRYNIRRSR